MGSLRRLWPYIVRYWPSFCIGAAAILACSWFRAIVPEYMGRTVDLVRAGDITRRELADWALLIFSFSALAGCFLFLMRRAIIDASREIEFDFRNDFFRQLQRLDPNFYDGHQTGDLMSHATNDIEAMRLAVGPGILYLVNTIFLLPLVLWRMIRLDPGLTLWAMLPLLMLPPLVQQVRRLLLDRSLEVQNQFGRLTSTAQENLAGIRVVKAYVQEQAEIGKFAKENEILIDRSLALARLQATFFPILHLMGATGLMLVLWVGGMRVIDGKMPVGELIAMTILFQMLVWPLIAFGWVISIWQRAGAAMERLNAVFDAEPLVNDGIPIQWPGPRCHPERTRAAREREENANGDAGGLEIANGGARDDVAIPSNGAAEAIPPEFLMRGEIEIRNLTFAYPGAEAPVLHGISLRVPAGSSLGIVGQVGSGKSTLASILCRLYPVARATVFIDGIDLEDWPLKALRRQIGVVFQESFVFSESIEENVAFGRSELTPEQAELSEAVMLADLQKDLDQMPEGGKTLLGERGINLSGGQRQRLSLARALIRDARIQIVDDALSAVDTQTEARIVENLRRTARDRTTLVAAHRLSALAWCDNIIVLHDGRIAESGPHAALLERAGHYADLWAKQQLEEEVEAIS